jgi:membrane fusion protein (multidrug efflux system)
MTRSPQRIGYALALCSSLALFGCGRQPAMPDAQPVTVKAMEIKRESVTLSADFVGEVRGSQEVEIRSRVSGILLDKHFEDGALVEKGQLLYTIDAREYRSQVAAADAQLASAQADLARAQQDVARYEPLLRENAISQQVYDNAVAAARQAKAQVEAARALVEEAKLGVEYTEVRAPMTGRVGASQVFEGALVTAGSTLLVNISADDPAWVWFSISEADLLSYQRQMTSAVAEGRGQAMTNSSRMVRLSLSDGRVYPQAGQINFADQALDPTTGTYRLRAEFPNAEHFLRPGMFGRISATSGQSEEAIVIPDRAVQEQLGRYFVATVAEGDVAELKPIELGARLGNRWIVTKGLAVGDRIVVEGIQRARPGTPLTVQLITQAELDESSAPTPAG